MQPLNKFRQIRGGTLYEARHEVAGFIISLIVPKILSFHDLYQKYNYLI